MSRTVKTLTLNKQVQNTQEQIFNTVHALNNCGFLRDFRDSRLLCDHHSSILTWQNHVSGRHNAGRSFGTINQYVTIYESGAYHCILFDGSILRCFFKFEKNILTQESLLYWPAPINIPDDEIEEFGIRESMDLHLSSLDSCSVDLRMRTPFRIDFDLTNATEAHPETHLHIQDMNCRISVQKPICFNTFIKFIFSNFYSEIRPKILNGLSSLNYSGYSHIDKAVVSL